jgi:hypothetical protein
MMKLLNETTQVPAEASLAEITRQLVSMGAGRISTEYSDGQASGLRWTMAVGGRETWFAMPVRVESVYRFFLHRDKGLLNEQRKKELWAKATRVAWRHLLRWTEAQAALVATSLIQPGEAFLSFAVRPGESQTLYEIFTRGLPAEETTQ